MASENKNYRVRTNFMKGRGNFLLQSNCASRRERSLRCFNSSFVPFFFFDAGHALDEKDEGNPIGDELLSLTQSLKKMTSLANNLTAEYKEKFDLLF